MVRPITEQKSYVAEPGKSTKARFCSRPIPPAFQRRHPEAPRFFSGAGDLPRANCRPFKLTTPSQAVDRKQKSARSVQHQLRSQYVGSRIRHSEVLRKVQGNAIVLVSVSAPHQSHNDGLRPPATLLQDPVHDRPATLCQEVNWDAEPSVLDCHFA